MAKYSAEPVKYVS